MVMRRKNGRGVRIMPFVCAVWAAVVLIIIAVAVAAALMVVV